MTSAPGSTDERRDRLADPRTARYLVWALYAVCAGLLLIDPLVHKHGPFAIEHWIGFYGIYGFVVSIGLVLVAKAMRRILMRPENYYDR
ncbi:hypothetical protein [Microbaculum marinum]|uniref:Uncharacterized protein n=1 Tax=Microbaculum marinum TaxID=1764581 RepID=A0AAW9RCJ3_9HYPH